MESLIEDLRARLNFRDLGGMRTEDGGRVAEGLLYRSALPSKLSEAQRSVLQRRLGIRTVIDVRRPTETSRNAPVHFSGARLLSIPLTTEGTQVIVEPTDAYASVADWYWRLLVVGGESIREIFERLADPDGAPVVIHCHAGKDRTGVIVALLLSVFGVSLHDILADYAATGRNDTDEWFQKLPPAFREADPTIMQILLERVDAKFGSADGYLSSIGLSEETLDALRERYVVPAGNSAEGPRARNIGLTWMRNEYAGVPLRRNDLAADPLSQFRRWLEESVEAGVEEPTAMVLATVSEGGQPRGRTVLLKKADDRGFSFLTNRMSQKGRDLADNPRASVIFPWYRMERQVTAWGHVISLSDEESDEYFAARPFDAQVGAWASRQSEEVESREALDDAYRRYEEEFSEGTVPRPHYWGGYLLRPREVEFWQGGRHRLHDRILYRRKEETDSWDLVRLAP